MLTGGRGVCIVLGFPQELLHANWKVSRKPLE